MPNVHCSGHCQNCGSTYLRAFGCGDPDCCGDWDHYCLECGANVEADCDVFDFHRSRDGVVLMDDDLDKPYR